MAKQSNQENLILHPQPNLSALGVHRESIKTIVKNGKPVGLILLLVILTTSQLKIAVRFSLKDLSFRSSRHGSNPEDIRELLEVKLFVLLCSCYILLFFLVATVSSSHEAYTAKVLSLKDMLSKANRNLKRPFITSCYMSLLSAGIYIIYLITFGVISIMSGRWRVASSDLFFTLEQILYNIAYAYVTSLWIMSMVVSVLEDGVSGLKAIDRAGDLMKGRRIQASVMVLLEYIAQAVVGETFAELTMGFKEWVRMAIEILFVIGLICVFKLFVFVYYTILYHERKAIRKNEGTTYMPIATDGA